MADSHQDTARTIGEIEREARRILGDLQGAPPVGSDRAVDIVPATVPGASPAEAEPDDPAGPADRAIVAVVGKFDARAMSGSHDAILARSLGDKVVNCLGLSPSMSAAERSERASAAAAAMRELAPRNPAEGLLVAQMVAAHSAGLDRLGRAANMDRPADKTELHSRQAARLMGLFVRQYDSLLRNRERKRRTLRIEHVRMAADGQTSVRAEEERSQ